MSILEGYYVLFVATQVIHSLEETTTHFEKKWPLWRMSRKTFVTFEILFSILILTPIFWPSFPLRTQWMLFFNLLMFANGIWHLMWAGIEKKYIPGLVTAPIFIILFVSFYFKVIGMP